MSLLFVPGFVCRQKAAEFRFQRGYQMTGHLVMRIASSLPIVALASSALDLRLELLDIDGAFHV